MVIGVTSLPSPSPLPLPSARGRGYRLAIHLPVFICLCRADATGESDGYRRYSLTFPWLSSSLPSPPAVFVAATGRDGF